MKLAIMQPYFFPYLGYFQLMEAVDTFVFYDDVNYINRSYINRNSVLGTNGAQRITLELVAASQNRLINEIEVGTNRRELLKTMQMLSAKAPQAHAVMPVLEACLTEVEPNLALFLQQSLMTLATELGVTTRFLTSSELVKDNSLRGQDKILAICAQLGADTYINPQGGRELYSHDRFADAGIDLLFHEFVPQPYDVADGKRDYVPYLSVIDFLMWVPKEARAAHMASYRLAP
jgi:hypothetical protein